MSGESRLYRCVRLAKLARQCRGRRWNKSARVFEFQANQLLDKVEAHETFTGMLSVGVASIEDEERNQSSSHDHLWMTT